MSAIYLRQGDHLPAVGILQLLLNRAGAQLALDGHFGPRTLDAVRQFQTQRHLGGNGMVDDATFRRLCGTESLPIADSVDCTDPDLYNNEVRDIRAGGGRPITRGGMSNGVAASVAQILREAGRNVFLLRLHGHGSPGVIGVSDGLGTLGDSRTSIDIGTSRTNDQDLGRLRAIFGPYGCAQLMGCNTGEGRRGRALLSHLANLWGVPVTAGVQTQYAGGSRTFRFEGPTVTCCPYNGSIHNWLTSRPRLPSYSPR